jgi:hypothetical protein
VSGWIVRLSLCFAALALLGLGGSAGAGGSAHGALTTRDATPFAWRTAVLPPATGGHPASFGEPGIAVGRDGTVVVNAARANDGYPTWWLSRDGGKHWGAGRDVDATGSLTGDADSVIGPDGYLYALNMAFQNPPAQPTNPTILVYASADGGARWDGPAAFPPPHGVDQPDRPWLVADPYQPNQVFVANSEGAGNVVIWRSTDRGGTFSGPTLVTGADHVASLELSSRPLFDPIERGRMFMVYEVGPAPNGLPLRDFPLNQLWLAESEDAGASWTNRLVLDIDTAFGSTAVGGSLGHVMPASAVDDAGTLYAAFSLRLGTGTETHLYLIHSADHGVHWSSPVRVDSGSQRSNVMPWLVAGAPGRVALSWYGSRSPDFTATDSTWAEFFAQSTNASSGTPSFRQSLVSGSAPVHVGSVDTMGNPGSTLYDWGLRDFQSIAADACGMAHLAWTNDTGQGSTVTATQIAGASLRPKTRC